MLKETSRKGIKCAYVSNDFHHGDRG
ncbi:unnamed protein product, partial [Rotaria sp. Silwood1]